MRKLLIFISLLILVASPIGMVTSQPSVGMNVTTSTTKVNAAPATVQVGFLSPETGGLSAYSSGFENAAKLAIRDLNNTFTGTVFTIKFYDTQTTPEGATSAMTQAVTDGAKYVVGAAGSSNTLAAAAIAKQKQVPLISYASTSPAITTFNDSNYLWRVVPSDAYQGAADVAIARAANYSTAVIVNLDNAYGIGIADQFETSFKAAGGQVLAKLSYPQDKTDFSTEISVIKAKNPDVVFLVAYATDGSNFFVQLANQNIKVPVIGTDGIADNSIFNEKAGTQAAMMNVVATKPTAIGSPLVTAFDTEYNNVFHNTSGIYREQCYDAVRAGAFAVMNASLNEGSVTGPNIILELSKLDFMGPAGHIKFDSHGDVGLDDAAYEIDAVQASGFVKVGDWVSGTLSLYSNFTQMALTGGAASSPGGFLPFSFISVLAAFAVLPIITIYKRRKSKN